MHSKPPLSILNLSAPISSQVLKETQQTIQCCDNVVTMLYFGCDNIVNLCCDNMTQKNIVTTSYCEKIQQKYNKNTTKIQQTPGNLNPYL